MITRFSEILSVLRDCCRSETTLISDGDFAAGDFTYWTDASLGTGTAVVSTNAAVLVATSAANSGKITQAVDLIVGRTYEIVWATSGGAENSQLSVDPGDGTRADAQVGTAATTESHEFTATGPSGVIGFAVESDSGTCTVDDVIVREVGHRAIEVVQASGIPTYGKDATGADAHATVLTSPNRECHHLHASVQTKDAIVSLDGGTTDHLWIPIGASVLFSGLKIPPGSVIQGKNGVGAQNYANLAISVW